MSRTPVRTRKRSSPAFDRVLYFFFFSFCLDIVYLMLMVDGVVFIAAVFVCVSLSLHEADSEHVCEHRSALS